MHNRKSAWSVFWRPVLILFSFTTAPSFAFPLPGLPPTELAMNFDLSGSRGELQFNDSTGEISMVPTVVTQIFQDDTELFSDPFIGLNVEGFGRFLGEGSLFPDIQITEFALQFLNGFDPVLTFESGTHFPRFVDGSSLQAFDLGIMRVTKFQDLVGSDFLAQFAARETR